MLKRKFFPVKNLQPQGAFLTLKSKKFIQLTVPFLPFYWQDKIIETEICADLFNHALPSPYLRDLVNQQFLFSETENGIYPENTDCDMGKIQKIEAFYYLGEQHPVIISELNFMSNKEKTAVTLLIKGYFDFEFEGLDNYSNTPFVFSVPVWSGAI